MYDELLGDDELERLPKDKAAAYIDFAGDAALRRAIHERFGSHLRYSCSVGGTHHDALGGARGPPGPKPELFFAPARIMRQRSAPPPRGLGHDAPLTAIDAAWLDFIGRVTRTDAPWLVIEEHRGVDAVRNAYLQALAGRTDPRVGLMLGL